MSWVLYDSFSLKHLIKMRLFIHVFSVQEKNNPPPVTGAIRVTCHMIMLYINSLDCIQQVWVQLHIRSLKDDL